MPVRDDAGAHREAASLRFPVEVCERTPACPRAAVRAATRAWPRGAAELGQLQDHYHQNDYDQDSDDDSDDSSVHFASLDTRADPQLQIRPFEREVSLTSESELREASAIRGPIPLRLQLNHPNGGCITPLGRLKPPYS
jgi:hypothetical protein